MPYQIPYFIQNHDVTYYSDKSLSYLPTSHRHDGGLMIKLKLAHFQNRTKRSGKVKALNRWHQNPCRSDVYLQVSGTNLKGHVFADFIRQKQLRSREHVSGNYPLINIG